MTIRTSETPDAATNRIRLSWAVRSCHAVRSRNMRRSSDSISRMAARQSELRPALSNDAIRPPDTLGIAGHHRAGGDGRRSIGRDTAQDCIDLLVDQTPHPTMFFRWAELSATRLPSSPSRSFAWLNHSL